MLDLKLFGLFICLFVCFHFCLFAVGRGAGCQITSWHVLDLEIFHLFILFVYLCLLICLFVCRRGGVQDLPRSAKMEGALPIPGYTKLLYS